MLDLALIFGTRPEAIKMAPVVKYLQRHPDLFACRICVTAQHRQMLDQVLELFGIDSQHDLDIMMPNQGLRDVTVRALDGIDRYLAARRPDCVLVHGDTTTTFAASLAAFYHQVPVGHVEAGLRTGQRYSPFPEEMNRKLTSALTTLHFCPTPESRQNLLRERIDPGDTWVTGNTAIDALHLALERPQLRQMAGRFAPGKRGILVTAHRRENFGAGIRAICGALRRLALARSDIHVVYPVHYNPNIRGPVGELLGGLERVTLIDPVEYDVFVRLMADCHLILTDSGGVQEEAPSLGKPVLVLRACTERPEAVAAGTVRLVGTDEDRIVAEAERLLDDAGAYEAMARAINPYGDGLAAPRIGSALLRRLAGTAGPDDALGEFTGAAVDGRR